MKSVFTKTALLLASIAFLTACGAQAEANAEPTVDIIGTTAAELASVMLTQTAGAVTPTPLQPTETPTPQFTETPTLEPAPVETTFPQVSGNTACYTGPGVNYPLVSNISDTEEVYVLGISAVPGWYVIENPIYGSMCWISADNMRFEADFDLSTLPVIP